MRRRVWPGALRGLTLALALGAMDAPAAATAQAPAPYIYVVTITAKLDRMQDFQTYERQINEARRRTGDPRSVYVYQVAAGGPVNRFHVVIPFDDLAEIDSWPTVPDLLVAGFGEEEGARIYAAGVAAEESVQVAVQVLQPDWTGGSALTPSGTSLTHLVTTRVHPSRRADYEAFLAALKAAEDEHGVRRIRRNITMGELFTYTSVSQSDGWTDVRAAPGPGQLIREEYGEAMGGRLLAGADAAIVSRTIEVLRYREDLSYEAN